MSALWPSLKTLGRHLSFKSLWSASCCDGLTKARACLNPSCWGISRCESSCTMSYTKGVTLMLGHFFPAIRCLCIRPPLPEPSLLHAEQPQLSQHLLIWQMLQHLNHLFGPLLDSVQHVHDSLVVGTPDLGVASPALKKGKHRIPPPDGIVLPNATQDTTCLLCSKGALMARSQLGVHQEPQGCWS